MTGNNKRDPNRITIKIPSDKRRFFRQMLELIKGPVLPDLKNKELDVLAQLLYYHNRYRHYDDEAKWLMVFHRENRKEMREYLGMERATFDNYVSALKKKSVLKNNTIAPEYIITLDENAQSFTLNYLMEFNDASNSRPTPQDNDRGTNTTDHDPIPSDEPITTDEEGETTGDHRQGTEKTGQREEQEEEAEEAEEKIRPEDTLTQVPKEDQEEEQQEEPKTPDPDEVKREWEELQKVQNSRLDH